jgi:hypothetical protein
MTVKKVFIWTTGKDITAEMTWGETAAKPAKV